MSLSSHNATTVTPQLIAEARFVLAQALWSKRPERALSRTLAEQARDALAAAQGPGNSNLDVDDVNAWLATHRIK